MTKPTKETEAGPAPPKRWALYTRESTEEQLAGKAYDSHESQADFLRNWVKSKGGTVYAVYRDTKSGTKLERDGLLHLLADAEAGKFDGAVAYDLDRWHRSIEIFALMKRLTRETGVRFESATQPFSDDPEGELMETQVAAFAQYYSRLVSRKVRIKRNTMVAKGLWRGGPIPYGYQAIEKKLSAHPEEAKVLCAIFELFLEHPSVAAVRERLRALGFVNRKGVSWSNSSLESILRNRVYLGESSEGGVWHSGHHPPLIDRTVFEKAQKALPTRRRLRSKVERPYILADVLRCAECDSSMTPHYVSKKAGKSVAYYRCTQTFKRGWSACSIRQVNADKVEAFVADLIEELSTTPELVARATAAANELTDERSKPLREKQAALESRLREIKGSLKHLVEVIKATGVAGFETVREEMEQGERDRALVEAELSALAEECARQRTHKVDAARVQAALGDLRLLYEVATPAERRDLVRLMFRRVVYNGPGKPVSVELFDRKRVEPHGDDPRGSKIHPRWLRMRRFLRTLSVNGFGTDSDVRTDPRRRSHCDSENLRRECWDRFAGSLCPIVGPSPRDRVPSGHVERERAVPTPPGL